MAATHLPITTTTVRFGGKVQKIHTITPVTSKQFMELFNKYDHNGNGTIEKTELTELIEDLLRVSIAEGKVKDVKKKLLKTYDENHDGKLSLAELSNIIPVDNYMALFGLEETFHIVDFMQVWLHYDEDNSGDLELDELKSLLFDLANKKHDVATMDHIDKYAKAIMDKYDKEHNSKISLSELIQILPVEDNYMSHYGKFVKEDEFEEIFQHYDRDGNGIIEGTELMAFVKDVAEKNGKEPTIQEIKKFQSIVMEIFDKNHDGRITRPELRMVMLGH